MNLACVVLAAGKGSRMKGCVPKPLIQFEGRSFLEGALEAAKGANPDKICVVVRHEREKIEEEARKICPSCVFALQDEVPGTGRAMECALEVLKPSLSPDSLILASASDIPLLSSCVLLSLLKAHKESGAAATLLATKVEDPFGYGRVITSPSGEVKGIVEEKDAGEEEKKVKLVNASVYAFNAGALLQAQGKAERKNAQGEVYLTDLFMMCKKSGKIMASLCRDPLLLRGVNDPCQLLDLKRDWERRQGRK
ncbi:MAG: NTP transferase domain-containing protein [Aeriscardovia sp.]|nr:NTP transferase domain-containing protein [Aeriscardovia sp.]